MNRSVAKQRGVKLTGAGVPLLAFLAFAGCGGGGNNATVVVQGGGGGGGSTGAGGQAGGGQGGSGSGGQGQGGTGPATCTGCGSNQLCVNGACMDLPSQCPCPVESYCDLSSNKCVVGCTTNDQCSTGRACNTTSRMCVNGCRDDASCGAGRICDNFTCHDGCRQNTDCSKGSICVNTVCQTGCATTADCTATGQSCVNMSCACPSSQLVCNNACTAVNTLTNCGSCGNACGKNQVCTSGQCMCPNGTCQPETVYTTTNGILGLWIDGGYVYTFEGATTTGTTGTTYTFHRGPVAGGTAQLVATVPAGGYPGSEVVSGGTIAFSVETSGDAISNVPENDFYMVPGAGGLLREIAMNPEPIGSPLVAINGNNVYYWDYTQYDTSMSQLWTTPITGSGGGGVATYYTNPWDYMLPLGTTIYMVDISLNGSNYDTDVQSFTGSTTLGSVFDNTTAQSKAIIVDSSGFYSSDLGNTSKTESLVHTPLNGKNPVTLAPEGGRSLSTDDTRLYYLTASDMKSIRRVLKAGGTPETFYADPAALKAIVVNTGYVYFANATTVRRLVTTLTP
jgi:hypothetical protein